VPPEELGSPAGHHRARDYARYKRYERENMSLDSEPHDAAHARYTNETQGMKRGQNMDQGLVRVSMRDLHKPDMLYTIYLGRQQKKVHCVLSLPTRSALAPPPSDPSPSPPISGGRPPSLALSCGSLFSSPHPISSTPCLSPPPRPLKVSSPAPTSSLASYSPLAGSHRLPRLLTAPQTHSRACQPTAAR